MGFNSRTREGATKVIKSTVAGYSFNSRTREGATSYNSRLGTPYTVSIHAPVKVRQIVQGSFPCRRCFNSRTREGATTRIFPRNQQLPVSIHAPVKVRLHIAIVNP